MLQTPLEVREQKRRLEFDDEVALKAAALVREVEQRPPSRVQPLHEKKPPQLQVQQPRAQKRLLVREHPQERAALLVARREDVQLVPHPPLLGDCQPLVAR